MEFIFLLIGIVIGILITRSHFGKRHTYGYIDVDPKTGQCRVCISSDELKNKQIKQAIFLINHDVDLPIQNDISRDEPPL